MTLKQKPVTTIRLQIKPALLILTGCGIIAVIISLLIADFGATQIAEAAAPYETMDSGSYIVNTGIVPQTYNNGLKPYGMVYDLIANYDTQVKWVIDTAKAKDAKDFTYNAVDYKGGPFIIPAALISATVKTRITYWQTQGVSGLYTTAAVSVPVYATLTCIPRMTVDNSSNNVGIIAGYFTNAGIPSTAYQQGPPDSLTSCHDLWINPHGDPTWATHNFLYNFASVNGSFIFSQCHATSMMEGSKNTVSPFEQLNFLTTAGLKCYSSGKCGPAIIQSHGGSPTLPISCYYPGDPIMQFMGYVDGSLTGGSEDWFIPQSSSGGQWRTTTKQCVTTSDGIAPKEGVLVAYGPAFGLTNKGYALYEAGHDLDNHGTTAEKVAAQRIFFNYMFFATTMKSLKFSSVTVPSTFASSDTRNISVTVTSGNPSYTYQWTSTVVGGSFGSATSAATTYHAPVVAVLTNGVLTCKVTDACGRKNFVQRPFVIDPSALPVTLGSFTAYVKDNNKVQLNWTTASEKDNDYFTLERSSDGLHFNEIKQIPGAGTSNVMNRYAYLDEHPLTGNSYYRLKQTDYNGKSETFKPVVVYVKSSAINNIRVYPNPFSTSFTAEFESSAEEAIDVQLISIDGSVIHTEKIMAVLGRNSYQFTAESPLINGTYVLRLTNGRTMLAAIKINVRNN